MVELGGEMIYKLTNSCQEDQEKEEPGNVHSASASWQDAEMTGWTSFAWKI